MEQIINFDLTKDTLAERCPRCQGLGQKVPLQTVQSLVRGAEIPEASFSVCLDETCPVVYFHGATVYTVDDVAVKVWFKEADSPKTICYCRDVTDLEIIQHVAIDQCCSSLADLQKHTGVNTGQDCLTKNPTGQ